MVLRTLVGKRNHCLFCIRCLATLFHLRIECCINGRFFLFSFRHIDTEWGLSTISINRSAQKQRLSLLAPYSLDRGRRRSHWLHQTYGNRHNRLQCSFMGHANWMHFEPHTICMCEPSPMPHTHTGRMSGGIWRSVRRACWKKHPTHNQHSANDRALSGVFWRGAIRLSEQLSGGRSLH